MAYIPSLLFPTNFATTSGSTLYTVPANKSAIVKNIVLTNTTSLDATVSVHVVASGGTAQVSNRILSDYGIPQRGMSTLDCSIVMPEGSSLYASSSANNAITVTVSGVEVS